MADTTIPGSYISVGDFTQSFTGIDPATLSAGELARAIKRASDWVNRVCKQILFATTDNETWINGVYPQGFDVDQKSGYLYLWPRNFPIRKVTALSYQYGVNATSTIAIDLSTVMVFPRYILVQGDWRRNALSPDPLLVNITYTNGWAAATLASAATATSTTITLVPQPLQATVQGFLPGTQLEIQDGLPEIVTVLSVAGNVITLTAPLAHNHAADTMVAPPDFSAVQQATLLYTSYLIKSKGLGALALHDNEFRPGPHSGGDEELIQDAVDLLTDFIVHW